MPHSAGKPGANGSTNPPFHLAGSAYFHASVW
jgi:hypothetical protein